MMRANRKETSQKKNEEWSGEIRFLHFFLYDAGNDLNL